MHLQQRTLSADDPGPHLLITGGVHGDEYEPMEAVRALIDLLPERLNRGKVTLIPVVNESAFRLGRRVGDDGLDLARTCPGSANGSVTERTAHALSQHIQEADYYIDLHTGGSRLNVLPLVGYVLHRDRSILDQQRAMAKAFGLPVIWGTNAELEGRSLSVARDAGVPALYAEYHGHPFDPEGVDAYRNGCLRVMRYLDMIDDAPTASGEEQLVVEDDRPGSGHMQDCQPAPCEGLFRPSVVLGQRVEKGEVLGTIGNVLGDVRTPVCADRTGIVLVLHGCPRIGEGDSVAVISEA